jgi:hypothetical protein
MSTSPRGDLAHERPPLGRAQPVARRLGDHRPAVKCDLFLMLGFHVTCSVLLIAMGPEA